MRSLLASRFTRFMCVLLAALMTGGCGTMSPFTPGMGKKYVYIYRLKEPSQNELLRYEDGRITAEFTVDEAAVRFRLQNGTDRDVQILWGGVVIGIDNRFYPVRHATDLYADSADTHPFPLPPGGYVRDLVIPANSMRLVGDAWVETPLFRTVDGGEDSLRTIIRENVGRTVRLRLPIRFADTTMTYTFGLQVADVRTIAWRDYVPEVREPRPPEPVKNLSKNDRTVTIAIVVGFLGMFALLVTADKDPPSE